MKHVLFLALLLLACCLPYVQRPSVVYPIRVESISNLDSLTPLLQRESVECSTCKWLGLSSTVKLMGAQRYVVSVSRTDYLWEDGKFQVARVPGEGWVILWLRCSHHHRCNRAVKEWQ